MYRLREREREVKLPVLTAYEREKDEQEVVASLTPHLFSPSDNHIGWSLWLPWFLPFRVFHSNIWCRLVFSVLVDNHIYFCF